MRKFLLLVTLLALAGDAQARFARSSLNEVVERSEIILDAQVISGRAVEWQPSDSSAATCGYVYEARVNQALKGSSVSSVEFSSPKSLVVGRRYLLFLNSYEGDFPTDLIILKPPEEEERKAECLNALPALKASWLHSGTFLPNALSRDQFVELSYHLVPPKDAMAAEVIIDRLRSRGELINFGDEIGTAQQAAPEAVALLSDYAFGSTVVSWSRLQKAILEAVAHQAEESGGLSSNAP